MIWLVAIPLFALCLAYIKKCEQLKNYRDRVTDHESRFLILSQETEGIASLNKYCIEKWENSVRDNKQLLDSNAKLLDVIQRLQDDLRSIKGGGQ